MTRSEFDANVSLAATPRPAAWTIGSPRCAAVVKRSFFARLLGL